jgi:hypothetical protein
MTQSYAQIYHHGKNRSIVIAKNQWMVVLKAHNQWKKFLLTLKNQHKVEVTNMPNADLKIF